MTATGVLVVTTERRSVAVQVRDDSGGTFPVATDDNDAHGPVDTVRIGRSAVVADETTAVTTSIS